jgi:hypothetical protein
VGPRAGLGVCEKFHPHRDFFYFAYTSIVKQTTTPFINAFMKKLAFALSNSFVVVITAGLDPRTVPPVVSRYTD